MNIAIIPARAGSKGIPNKNVVKLWDKSLLGWAIVCARETGLFDKIILSTDSEEYWEEAKKYKCDTLSLRPEHLSNDTSNINDVLKYMVTDTNATEWSKICLLEPSCPLRTPQLVLDCFNELSNEEIDSSLTVTEVSQKYNLYKQFIIQDSGYIGLPFEESARNVNRQSLPKTYVRNGAAYCFKKKSFLQFDNILCGQVKPIITLQTLINLDTQHDLKELREFEEKNKPSYSL